MRKIIAHLASLIPLSFYKSMQWSNLVIANYHSILNADIDNVINNRIYRTCEEMEDDLKFYKKNYQVITVEDFVQYVKKGRRLKSKSLLITFDDGLGLLHKHVLPVFRNLGTTAILFLNNSFIDNADLHFERKANALIQYLEGDGRDKRGKARSFLESKKISAKTFEEQVRSINYSNKYILDELALMVDFSFSNYLQENKPYLDTRQIQDFISSGFGVGAHSLDHPNYVSLTLDEQVEQTVKSINDITQRFNLDYRLFALPYGDDSHITKEFFNKIKPNVDATFGIRGMLKDVIPIHFQRFGVEQSELPIRKAISFEYIKSLTQRISGKGIIARG